MADFNRAPDKLNLGEKFGPDNEELNRPLRQGLPVGQLTVVDSDHVKYQVTVTKVARASVEHGTDGASGKVAGTDANSIVDITCNCRFFVHYRMHCVHMFAVFNACQLRTAQYIRPQDRWTKRYNWENFASTDLNLMPAEFAQEARLKELERKDFERLTGG